MKAIQIKFLPCTDTQPTRLKAWAEGCKGIIECRDTENEIEVQALRLAIRFWEEMGWDKHSRITGSGMLPCGDYVMTLAGKEAA